jgi:hypothetical protein
VSSFRKLKSAKSKGSQRGFLRCGLHENAKVRTGSGQRQICPPLEPTSAKLPERLRADMARLGLQAHEGSDRFNTGRQFRNPHRRPYGCFPTAKIGKAFPMSASWRQVRHRDACAANPGFEWRGLWRCEQVHIAREIACSTYYTILAAVLHAKRCIIARYIFRGRVLSV